MRVSAAMKRLRSAKAHGRLAWAIAFGTIVAYQGYEIFVHPRGATRVAMPSRPVIAGEIAGAAAASQTFRTSVPGFDGITIYPIAYGAAVLADVGFALYDCTAPDHERLVAGAMIPARNVLDRRTFTWTVPPIDDPTGHRYRFEIRVPDAAAGHGLGLYATREATYRDGRFHVAGVEQWGDLVFATEGRRATVFANREALLRHAPGPLQSSLVAALAVMLFNMVIGFLLYAALRPGTIWHTSQSSRAPSGGI